MISINDTQIMKLTDLYNENDKRDDKYYSRMLEAQENNDLEIVERMKKFRLLCREREMAYDHMLSILGLRAVPDDNDPEGMYKIIKR